MIVYNMRYRGAIEYEKLLLNILSYHNHVHAICVEEQQEGESKKTIESYIQQCYALIDVLHDTEGATMQCLQKQFDTFTPIQTIIGETF